MGDISDNKGQLPQGPWSVASVSSAVVFSNDGNPVAVVVGHLPDRSTELTAQMIAAAPEMSDRIAALTAERDRLKYVLEGVRGAINTGRNEPLQVWAEHIEIVLDALKEGGR